MKELAVISGKGGTGKTSIMAAFAVLAQNKVIADCDVHAADLQLILFPDILEEKKFCGEKIAILNKDKCVECGKCISWCRHRAINKKIEIDPVKCEGCGVCFFFCPENAITLKNITTGKLFISNTQYGPMVHARLQRQEGNSGKLVSFARNEAMRIAKENYCDLIITDGLPGTSCHVIASIAGASFVLIVTEPSVSGLHDLKRVSELTRHFKLKTAVCINKYDLNNDNVEEIKKLCKERGIEIVASIPYNIDFTKAQLAAKSIVEYSDCAASSEIKKMWQRISNEI